MSDPNQEMAGAQSPVEMEVLRIRELLGRRQYGEAELAAQALALKVPENRDVLYLIAVSQRYLNDISGALGTLERMQHLHPKFSRLYQERGHCRVALKDAPGAIEAYLMAVNVNPALPASWNALESLYRMVGDQGNASVAASHVATLKALPPEIITAKALLSDGDLAPAENLVRGFLLKNGHHVEAMRLLALIGIERGVFDDAELLLEALLELAPDYRAARYDYARVLLERQSHSKAARELESLLALDPDNRQYKILYAATSVGLGEHEKGVRLYRELLVNAPRDAELHLSVAHALKTLGRREESIESYHAAAAARPGYGDAYWSLANLKTYRFADSELLQMRSAEEAPGTTSVDKLHLCFALGKAYEDRGDYPESFRYYQKGNDLKKAEIHFRPEPIERNTRLQKETCTREFFARRSDWGAAAADPIFIVGLPRSGSTLLEQILASHSKVEGTQELANIPRLVHEFQGRDPDLVNPRYPRILGELTQADFLRLGERYLSDTRVYRTDKPYFIDKMPNNFRHIGLIHLVLPNAKIIDARREPLACCFSNFKQLFASGQEFTYGIDDIARYYRTYLELMRHWNDVLPGRILRVEHEDVVENLELNVRRILDYCGLEFESACLEFYKTERSVRTASSEQVRRPISREGLDQWKNFEPWLEPLKARLGDALTRYRE